MTRPKKLYTTAEYVIPLKVPPAKLSGTINSYQIKGDFMLFPTAEDADKDAQWLVDYYKREGTRRRKPIVYEVRLVRVTPKRGKP